MEVNSGTEAVSPLSPENFHVSLASLMLGHDPVIPAMSPSPESERAEALPTEHLQTAVDQSREESKQGFSSEEASTSEAASESDQSGKSEELCKKPCKKHRNQNDECVEDSSEADPTISTSEAETSSKCSSSEPQPTKGKKSKARSESTHTSSKPISDAESSAKSNEVSTSASTNEGDSSGAAETTDNDDLGWTLSEDAKLRGTKEDDRTPTWVEISNVVGKSKKECQLRWKVLKDQPKQSDADEEGEKSAGESTGDAPKNKSKGAKKQKQIGVKQQKQKQKQKQKEGKQPKNKSPPPSPFIRSGDIPSSSSASSSDSDPRDMTFAGASASQRRQKRYMHKHVHGALYGRSISPEPDDYFSQRDCDVLASIESKYKQGKYLEMQANFSNVTGRMIPLSIIRDKCERAEEEEEKGRAKARKSTERKRVEKWVTSVDDDDLEDPES